MIIELSLIFVVTLIMIKLITSYALKLRLVDIPNERSMHLRHHPRGAGIGFFLAVALVEPFFHFQLLYEHYIRASLITLTILRGKKKG